MKFRLALLLLSLANTASAQPKTPQEVHRAVREAGGLDPFLKEIVRQTASMLPMRPNQNVEIVGAMLLGREVRYQSRLLFVSSRSSVSDMSALQLANTNYAACSSPVMSVMIKEYGVTLTYVSLSKNNEYLYAYSLDKETCRGR